MTFLKNILNLTKFPQESHFISCAYLWFGSKDKRERKERLLINLNYENESELKQTETVAKKSALINWVLRVIRRII